MISIERSQWGPGAVALFLGLFLLVFLVIPVFQVIYVAFQDPNTGALTLINFVDFFNTSLFRESFVNSFYVAAMSVVLASVFALPLAYFTTRFNFGGAILIQTLGVIPLIMPPFVGAVAMLLLFGENGSINLLLDEYFGFTIPFMSGDGVFHPEFLELPLHPEFFFPLVFFFHLLGLFFSLFLLHPIWFCSCGASSWTCSWFNDQYVCDLYLRAKK